jgi:hypothetical protein
MAPYRIVFAGYGLSIPEAHWDDLKGLNVKGAVVAFLTGGPDKIDGNLRSHYSSTEQRWKVADDLLADSQDKFSEIVNSAHRQQQLPHFQLASSIKATLSISTKSIASKNLIGLRLEAIRS